MPVNSVVVPRHTVDKFVFEPNLQFYNRATEITNRRPTFLVTMNDRVDSAAKISSKPNVDILVTMLFALLANPFFVLLIMLGTVIPLVLPTSFGVSWIQSFLLLTIVFGVVGVVLILIISQTLSILFTPTIGNFASRFCGFGIKSTSDCRCRPSKLFTDRFVRQATTSPNNSLRDVGRFHGSSFHKTIIGC